MVKRIEECLSSLLSRHINGIFAKTSMDACEKILDLIPKTKTVGIGDSTTIREIGVIDQLRRRRTRVLDPFAPKGRRISSKDAYAYTERICKKATICDVFLTGTNAITLDGRLVNVDGNGNRVAGMFWGHPVSVIVVGRNKIVKDLDNAFDRIRKVIAPNHTLTKTTELGGSGLHTPCAITGECKDCRSKERACNIFTIIEGKPFHTDLNVVIVDEDLGLGWDPSWPKTRIIEIVNKHKKYIWIPTFKIA